ncbi:hypothetical protein ACOQNP_14100 [Ectopseudomonas khazarica]|uniref:hypothetical protein n=1 Tax=Ectopseudomonas khazarica TaxID=2502979 RepID=UPI003B960B99
MHVLTRAGVAIASLDKYHPELKDHIDTLKAMGAASKERHGLTWDDLVNGPPERDEANPENDRRFQVGIKLMETRP